MSGSVKQKIGLVVVLSLVALFAITWIGCDEPAPANRQFSGPSGQSDQRAQIFETFSSNLNHLEDFPPAQMLPQLRDYLNLWLRESKPTVNWKRDPALDTLPTDLQKLPALNPLDTPEFGPADVEFLQEAVWLRDIARTARGEGFNEAVIAQRLFDWTVRNLQLEPDDAEDKTIKHNVSEILLLGRATAIERAWVFILLCRQLGIDAVMLALPDEKDSTKLRPCLPAVLVKGELYLFDPRLGLPIPGPDGRPVATLAEAVADDSLFRSLDLNAEHPYPIKASDLTGVVALVEASPDYLTRGAKLVESKLAGNNRVVLSTSPSATIEKLKAVKGIADARLWTMPFEVEESRMKRTMKDRQDATREMLLFLTNSPLRSGRVRQFKGDLDGEKGAKRMYLDSRPPREELESVRLSEEQKRVFTEMKLAASLWLGIMAYEEKDYPVAIDYFKERVIAADPKGVWIGGARYNLGRTYEATGENDKAIAMYQLDASPQSTGNKLRAKRLAAAKPQNEPPAKSIDKK